jgi:putative transposase
MYSYEDRIRAVELYIKLGKRVRPAIRQLGYPTKNSLKGWYNEYRQMGCCRFRGHRPKLFELSRTVSD